MIKNINISFQKVLKCHKRGRSGKRLRKSIVRFELSTLVNAYKIYQKIENKKFDIKNYNSFVIFEPKKREIETLRYEDRIVQHLMCDDLLAPYFSKRAVIDNCVCQRGKGTHFALRRLEKMLTKFIHKNNQEGYVLKCDIKKYFPSISHQTLKEIFIKEDMDERIKEFLTSTIDSYHTSIAFLQRYNIPPLAKGEKTERGVPIGNQTSQIFGMFYLNSLDRLIKEKLQIKIYSRYMDDFVIVHKDKNYLKYVLGEIKKELDRLHLQLNSRTQIFPLKNGLTYLGYSYQVTKDGGIIKKVVKKTKKRLWRRARLLEKAYIAGWIDKAKVKQSLAAYHGHLKHGNCWRLESAVTKKLIKVLKEKEKTNGKHK